MYIIVSACLVTYLFSNLNIVKNGLKLLNEKEAQAQKRMTLEFMLKMDSGKGITEAEFVLAILEHEGIISKETHIKPWAEVRYAIASFNCYLCNYVLILL